MKLCWDIETNGLDPDVVWILCAQDIDTGEQYAFSDHDPELPGMSEGIELLNKAALHVGHNLIGYDMVVMKKLYDWEPPEGAKVHDTWIISQLNSFKRPHRHNMAAWGEKLGHAKIEFNDWEKYSQEMKTYCVQDVVVNVHIYNALMVEVQKIVAKKPNYIKALQVEHEFAKLDAKIKTKGWLFDMEAAEKLLAKMQAQLDEISARVEPNLPEITIMIDKEPKTVKVTKQGNFHITTCKALSQILDREVFPSDALDPDFPFKEGDEYQRKEVVQATLGNMESVKEYLFSIGWKPDDWNGKRVNGQWIKTTPKLTETSLKVLGQEGIDIGTFYSTRNRVSVLKGWIENVTGGRLKGRMWTIGTPTFRVRHEVITNIPSVDAPWGKEMRSLLICEDGFKVVGADSAGNQMRALCHYIGDDDFTNEVIHGDVHQRNADVLGCKRSTAKGFLYAFMFGAGDAKLGEVLTGKKDAKAGREARAKFANSIPGLKALKDKLDMIFNKTGVSGNAWFPGLDGRRVYVDSQHQMLNYLLQSAEGITCKAAIVWAYKKLKDRGINFYTTLFYHDEMAFVVEESRAEEALDICVQAFIEAPKEYGVMCMGGDGTIGNNYSDVH